MTIKVLSLSEIKYANSDLNKDQKIGKDVVRNSETQKVSFKLLAVSDNKQKLIGIVHYTFHPTISRFEALNRKTLNF